MKKRPKTSVRRSLLPADVLEPVPDSAEAMPAAAAVAGQMGQLFSPAFFNTVLASVRGDFRDRVLNIEVVALMVLGFVVGSIPSFTELVQRLRSGRFPGLREVEVSAAAFFKRLETLPHDIFLELLRHTTATLAASQKHVRPWVQRLAPFAFRIFAVDDTTLDALVRRSKALKLLPKGSMQTLAGGLGCAVDLCTGKIAELIFDNDSNANEKNHVRPLVERLPAGSLYLLDQGYFSFALFDYLTDAYCYFLTRARKNMTFQVLHVVSNRENLKDRIIHLGKYNSARARYPVRLIEMRINGEWWRYLTNVLDPTMLRPEQAWALYSQRWTIEQCFFALKRALGMAYLRVSHQNGVLIQIWCTLAVYQVLQDLRLEISAENAWGPDEVSWEKLMRRISWHAEQPGQSSMRDWLIKNAKRLGLRKTGTRKRRLAELPPALIADCGHPPVLFPPEILTTRKPYAPTSNTRKKRSIVVVACLS